MAGAQSECVLPIIQTHAQTHAQLIGLTTTGRVLSSAGHRDQTNAKVVGRNVGHP